jgi:plastocyanin domain-containing protein
MDWIVLASGIALIATINWYFFLAGKQITAAKSLAGGQQAIDITVHGGYSPSVIRARQGQPLRLVFDRQETSGCSEEIVLPEFGIRKFLPPFKKTIVELKPDKPGSFEFTCGMGMLRGTLIVE